MGVAAKRAIRSFKIRRTKDGDEIIDVVLNDKSKALLIVAQHLRMLSNGIEEPEKKQGESIVYVLLADSEADEIRIEQLREGRMEIYMLAQLGGEHDGRIIIPEGVSEVIDVRGGKEITHLIEDVKPWKEESVDVAQYEVVNETPVEIETRQVREFFEQENARTSSQSRRKLRRY